MDRNLRLLGFGVGVRSLGNAIYFPFLALFLHGVLGVGYVELGIIIAAVGLVTLPFNLLGGLFADRVGRRRLILLGLGAEALSTLGLAYSFAIHSLAGAILTAILGGIIASSAGAAYQAYIADVASGSDRTMGFTWFRIGFNAGYSVGVSVGGFLISLIGFPWAVAFSAAVIGGSTIYLLLLLDPSPFDRTLELRGDAAVGIVTTPPGAPTAATPARGGPGSMGSSLRLIAKDRVALEVAAAFGLANLFLGQWSVTFPLFVHNVLGISLALLGFGLALNGAIVVFGQAATTRRVLGHRHTSIFLAGLGLYAIAFVGLGAAGQWGLFPLAAFFLAVLVLTIGENLWTIAQTTLPSNLAPAAEELGSYNGAFATIGGAGFLVAVVFGGVVLAATTNPLLISILLVLPAVPSVLLLLDAARRIPGAANRA